MKVLKITRLKLTGMAAAQLDGMGLTLADLLCIVTFARRTEDGAEQIYRFDIEQIPAAVRTELKHLAGVELHLASRAIVNVTRHRPDETGADGPLPITTGEREEEKR